MQAAKIGVIGGSGLYSLLEDAQSEAVRTPFGDPSGPVSIGQIEGVSVAFLARHGPHHSIPPHRINYRANIHAMKQVGVERLISVSAVGSLREEIHPGHLVFADQYFDRTKGRDATFYNELAVHVGFAEPICPTMRRLLGEVADELGFAHHKRGTYVCMEGPAFSTRAESHFYRSLGAHVIGMTNLPEAKLAREAEIRYATIALATDYDCWKEDEAAVEVHNVLETLRRNVEKAQRVVKAVVPRLAGLAEPPLCILDTAVMTDVRRLPGDIRERFAVLLARLLG